jgi:hypothetical protein
LKNHPDWTNPIMKPSMALNMLSLFDESGFLQHNGQKLIWLPKHLRGECTISPDGAVIVVGDSGAVTFVKM